MYTLIMSGGTARETPLFLIKRTFLLKSYKLPTWRAVFSSGLTWCALLPICVCIGDNKGKDYASGEGKLGHEKGDLFFLYCEGEFTVSRTVRLRVKTRRCLGLVLKFADNYVKLLNCYSEISAWFKHPEKLPLIWTVDRISHNSVNIYWPRKYIPLRATLSRSVLVVIFLRTLRKCKSTKITTQRETAEMKTTHR